MIITNKYIFGIILNLVLLFSCKSTISSLDSYEKKIKSPSNISTNKIDFTSELSNLDTITKSKLIKHSKNSKKSIYETYSINYADSLKKKLFSDGKLKINTYESFLVDYLTDQSILDTIYVSNLNVTSPKGGEVKSFEYNLKAEDHLYFEIFNLDKNSIESIEITEGSTTRFKQNNFKKKSKLTGNFKIESDNVVTLNISNNDFFKNKGLFKSNLHIILKKVSPKKKIKVEVLPDTIVDNVNITKIVNDTIYKVLKTYKTNLGPTIDLSKSNKLNFNINISEFDQLLGWGYWIGLSSEEINAFDNLNTDENPLIKFAKAELVNPESSFNMPSSENNDISLLIKNVSLDARTLNYSKNCAIYKSDQFTSQNPKKAEIYITNNSSLYDYDLQYTLIAVGLQPFKKETNEDIIAFKDYIHLTVLDNEKSNN